MEQIFAFVGDNVSVLIYILIAILLLVLLTIISNSIRRKKAASRFEELEKEVNEVRNNSLDYKFNKAKAFAKAKFRRKLRS